jgi:tryptophan synthase alpha subunit
MNIFRINTTAYKEEDFFLMTELSKEQIEGVITPIVLIERNNAEEVYYNDDLVRAIELAYPNATVEHLTEIENITI